MSFVGSFDSSGIVFLFRFEAKDYPRVIPILSHIIEECQTVNCLLHFWRLTILLVKIVKKESTVVVRCIGEETITHLFVLGCIVNSLFKYVEYLFVRVL